MIICEELPHELGKNHYLMKFFFLYFLQINLLMVVLVKNVNPLLLTFLVHMCYVNQSIGNSNWTGWSTIQGVIARVLSKSDERAARCRFEFTSTISP